MDIKKIIKEELDDFDWVKETPTDNLYIGATYTNPDDGDIINVTRIDDKGVYVTYNGLRGQYKNTKSVRSWLKNGVWLVESEFDWASEMKASNTEKFIDLLNKTLERLPILYRDREDEFSYGWINQVRAALQFTVDHEAKNQTMIGHVSLWQLTVMVIRSLDTIKMTVSGVKEYPDDMYEDAREKIEEVKDHLDVNLNTNSINL
jgi:hypothetical protein